MIENFKEHLKNLEPDEHCQGSILQLSGEEEAKAWDEFNVKEKIRVLLGFAEAHATKQFFPRRFTVAEDNGNFYLIIESYPSSVLGHPIYNFDAV